MISIIIPTYERHEAVVKTVLDLKKEIDMYLINLVELIIIDQSVDENPILIEIAKNTCGSIRYIKLKEPGLPNARNIGIHSAKGNICIFLDDDVIVSPRFIREHEKLYADPLVGAVAGRVVEANKKSINNQTPSNMCGINIFGRACPNLGGNTQEEVAAFRGGNFSFRKCITERIGYFDLRYEGSALLEESDYAYRIRKSGYKIIFSPEAELFHLELPSGGCRQKSELETQYWRLRNTTLFYLKNMPRVTFPLFVLTFLTIAGLKAKGSWSEFSYLISGFRDGYLAYSARLQE